MSSDGVHLTHCNFGENLGSCKYGEDETCPALKPDSPHEQAANELRTAWRNAVAAGQTESGFYDWAEANGDWRDLMDTVYAKLENNDGR
jgi:hypothetical protein